MLDTITVGDDFHQHSTVDWKQLPGKKETMYLPYIHTIS